MTNEEFFEKRSNVVNAFLNKSLIDKNYLSEQESNMLKEFIDCCFFSCFRTDDDKIENHIDSDGKYYGVYDYITVSLFETSLAGFNCAIFNPSFMHLQAIISRCLIDLQMLESKFFILDENNGWYEWYDDNVKNAE